MRKMRLLPGRVHSRSTVEPRRLPCRSLTLHCLLLCGVLAVAQGPRNQPRLVLQALDLNHDGTLSADEIKVAPTSLLTLDRTEDGQLSADEWSPPPPPEESGASPDELVQQLMAFDRNRDGVLTREELPSRMSSLFARADANHDDKLTKDEIRALARRQSSPQGPGGGPNPGATRMDPVLNALDTNHDGVISAEEIAAAPQSLLALDKNGDGQITADEMTMRQQTPQEMIGHFMDEFDSDHDGRISRAEAPENLRRQFESVDKNGDGYLDKDELLPFFARMGGRGGPGGPQREGRPESGPERSGQNPQEQNR